MIVNILINTQFLLLDSDEPISINLGNVHLSNDFKSRASHFYNTTAVLDIGILRIDDDHNRYSFAYQIFDVKELTDSKNFDEILIDINQIASKMKVYLDTFLSHLWFVKDNSICIDFLYGQALSNKDRFPSILQFNSSQTVMSDCNHAETLFTIDELNYAIYVWKKTYTICKNFKQELEPEIRNIEDLRNPLKKITKPNIKYHIYNKIERALLFLDNARFAKDLLLKIATYFSVLECLFSTERSDITYKISQRIALYIGNDFEERDYLRKFITNAYNIRSAYVHGSEISTKEQKPNGDFAYGNLLKVSKELDNLLRVILTKVIIDDSETFLDDNKLVEMFNKFIYQPNYYM